MKMRNPTEQGNIPMKKIDPKEPEIIMMEVTDRIQKVDPEVGVHVEKERVENLLRVSWRLQPSSSET